MRQACGWSFVIVCFPGADICAQKMRRVADPRIRIISLLREFVLGGVIFHFICIIQILYRRKSTWRMKKYRDFGWNLYLCWLWSLKLFSIMLMYKIFYVVVPKLRVIAAPFETFWKSRGAPVLKLKMKELFMRKNVCVLYISCFIICFLRNKILPLWALHSNPKKQVWFCYGFDEDFKA